LLASLLNTPLPGHDLEPSVGDFILEEFDLEWAITVESEKEIGEDLDEHHEGKPRSEVIARSPFSDKSGCTA
jgi:hypothetical protein